jgi:hypothetical protein
MRIKPIPSLSAEQVVRFWSRVEKSEGCWTWSGAVHGNGYCYVSLSGTDYAVHRVAYVLEYGDIPDGLVIDHLCRNHMGLTGRWDSR